MNNFIHPTAHVESQVQIGYGNYIGPFCYLTGKLTVGNKNRFESHCAVGTRPEHKDYWDEDGETIIGDNNVFREHMTIHAGSFGLTIVGDDCIMLRGAHVAHDCIIEDRVTLSCNAIMLGHVHVMQDSNCGTGCLVHQHQVVGAWSIIGMGCVVPKTKVLAPGRVWVGTPAKDLKENEYKTKEVDKTYFANETTRFMGLREKHGL